MRLTLPLIVARLRATPKTGALASGVARQPWFGASLVLATALALYLPALGRRDLWSSHEARAAQNARSILEDGQWLLPRLLDGQPEMQKPPLYYWLVALVTWPFGRITSWSVRLPAAIAGAATVWLLYRTLARAGLRGVGTCAAIILATLTHFAWLARVGRIDMPLAFCVTAALCALQQNDRPIAGSSAVHGCRAWRRIGIAWAFACISCGVLLKGPVAVVLVIVVRATWYLVRAVLWLRMPGEAPSTWAGAGTPASRSADRRQAQGRWSALVGDAQRRLLDWGVGLGVVALIAGPWYGAAHRLTQGEFTRLFLVRHTWQRALGGDDLWDAQIFPWWLYLARLPGDLFPWSVWLVALGIFYLVRLLRHPGAFSRAHASPGEADHRPSDPSLWQAYGATWFVSLLAFLSSLQFKRADYLLPAYPGLALALAGGVVAWHGQAGSRGKKLLALAWGATYGASLAGWAIYLTTIEPVLDRVRQQSTFARQVRRHATPADWLVLFRLESHSLTWHLGKPFVKVVEWENLDVWASQPARVYVVLRERDARNWRRHLAAGNLYFVCSNYNENAGGHEEPLELWCNRPPKDVHGHH
ncbi:MAG: hypothetical protein C4297_07610 [Gemmataceae bacterium]